MAPTPNSSQPSPVPHDMWSPSAGDDTSLLKHESALLLIYSLYRNAITLIIASLFLANTGLGGNHPTLFIAALVVYASGNLLLTWRALQGWQPGPVALINILASDIFLLQLMAAASGATQSGIGVLLIISVAAGSIFLARPQVFLMPALATITQLVNIAWDVAYQGAVYADFFAGAWLGIIYFATTTTIHYLVKLLRSSEAAMQREAQHAAQLEKLNSTIIERMQTGVVVIENNTLIICNAAAHRLLGSNTTLAGKLFVDLSSDLKQAHRLWKDNGTNNFSISKNDTVGKLAINFVALSDNRNDESLMFIEDLSKLTQRAQELKLASLGQLTASIAHEIRNPLGAISHAAQLLEEAGDEDSQKLTRIVREQTVRVNRIVDSILDVSRGGKAESERFDLGEWIENFVANYQSRHNCKIETQVDPNLWVNFDKSQLSQIVTNLVDNGLRYSKAAIGEERIVICAWPNADGLPLLEVLDHGEGVDEETLEHLFEPFFTTERSGSGLGLYISRELCEANQSALSYKGKVDSRTCFRIRFSHPDRNTIASTTQTTARRDAIDDSDASARQSGHG